MMIELMEVSRKFNSIYVLKDLDLLVQNGECLAVLGSNGTGKTTLLRIVSSLIRHQKGTVRIAGFELPGESELARKKIGVVFHEPMVYEELTPFENLKYYSQLYGKRKSDASLTAALEQVGLGAFVSKKVTTFSRGMKQRLAIVRAIIHDPEILLLDEPYTALDESGCILLNEIVKQFTAKGGCVVITSHDLTRLENSATRYGILDTGKIQKEIFSSNLHSKNATTWYQEYTSTRKSFQ
jgi:heme ABC exporter ATP-binding subunit CcmA